MDTGAWVLSPAGLEEGVPISDATNEDEGLIVATGEEETTRTDDADKVETTGGCEPALTGGD